MSSEPITLDVKDSIATLTLSRPDAGNAIDLPFARTLWALAKRCAEDSAIRCVVLKAQGRLFCAGGDIGGFSTAGENVSGYLTELAGTLHEGVLELMHMQKPLLTLVQGPAAGAGLSLAIMGDIVIAGRSAAFAAAYGGVGLSPDGGMSWMLPRLVGMRMAQEMIIANRRLSAEEAHTHGLVTRMVEDDALQAEGEKWAATLSAGATGAMGVARTLLLQSSEGGNFATHLDREVRAIAARGAHAEGREGVSAFLNKRKPDFKQAK